MLYHIRLVVHGQKMLLSVSPYHIHSFVCDSYTMIRSLLNGFFILLMVFCGEPH